MEQQVRACFTPLSGTLMPPPVDESPWGGTGAMHVFTAGGLRWGAHRAGETRPTQTWHHTEHMNRMSVRAAGSRSTTNSVVLKCVEQTLRVLWVTGLGAVSRLEPGPASLSAAPQPPLCLKCCSWGRVPMPIPTATPVISQGLPCLGPLPGLTRGPAGQLCGGLVAPLWGGGPGEVARALAGMGCGIY